MSLRYAEKLAKQNGFKIFYWKEGKDRVRITVRCDSTGNSLTTVDRCQCRGAVVEACVRELKKTFVPVTP